MWRLAGRSQGICSNRRVLSWCMTYTTTDHLSFPSLFLILCTAKSFGLGNDVDLKSRACPLSQETSSLGRWPSSTKLPPKIPQGLPGGRFLWAWASTGYLKQSVIKFPTMPRSSPGHSSKWTHTENKLIVFFPLIKNKPKWYSDIEHTYWWKS